MTEVTFTDDAIDDLRRIGPEAVPKVLKKILTLVDEPTAGHPLGGELTGYRKLVVGRNTWRIVYRITDDKTVEVCEVWAVGARADAEVYAEAIARVRDASADRPELTPLALAIEKLGRLAGEVVVSAAKPVEPVPDWLAERLIHSAGLTRGEVAALTLEEAVDQWAEFTSRPRR
ncbi:type II toxin-antitoxin system mRNA interferase toxin, RelE/StbE family [Yinghuangia sp. ASG 101]|uniref:type II toxin-antitoxin system RelE family toxin n=1 Tax=Yinghuangia sp. ASG 101 TaxID=2896848 RepID=UPI001E4C36B5|nr:type II toxin-antitoxin system mRNA interferase toxin, RelE/StbE family [Yinghuangia sp. ASG 101]UGQ11117.1 type II toxin-antitoxin system mRNA interferase toxin, RelE/StbE family [Yinghuangia sp. ASG 101]